MAITVRKYKEDGASELRRYLLLSWYMVDMVQDLTNKMSMRNKEHKIEIQNKDLSNIIEREKIKS